MSVYPDQERLEGVLDYHKAHYRLDRALEDAGVYRHWIDPDYFVRAELEELGTERRLVAA